MLFAEYKKLYDSCQDKNPKVKSKFITDKIKEFTGKQFVYIMDSLDTEVLRGYFISSDNSPFKTLRELRKNVIVIAKGQNECWERFVTVKEAMHLFDSDEDLTDTADKFVGLLSAWSTPSTFHSDESSPYFADHRAIWMALGCFCPEFKRQEFLQKRKDGLADDYAVALELKIPQIYVPLLWLPSFPAAMEHLKG